MRLTNAPLGGVEVTVDEGRHWLLVARVARPAKSTASGGASEAAEVERASQHGMAIGVGDHKLLRLLPDTVQARRDPAAIVVNVPSTFALFTSLLPPAGSRVQQVVNRSEIAMPPGYEPQEGDVLVIQAARPPLEPDQMPAAVADAASRYNQMALTRLRARGRKPVEGYLTVTARTAAGDKPTSIVFSVDGAPRAIINTAPYTVRMDTRDWGNGEHLVEVRAYNSGGVVVTQTRALVVVDNKT